MIDAYNDEFNYIGLTKVLIILNNVMYFKDAVIEWIKKY